MDHSPALFYHLCFSCTMNRALAPNINCCRWKKSFFEPSYLYLFSSLSLQSLFSITINKIYNKKKQIVFFFKYKNISFLTSTFLFLDVKTHAQFTEK